MEPIYSWNAGQKCRAFCKSGTWIIIFTAVHHWTLPWSIWIWSTFPHLFDLWKSIILSSSRWLLIPNLPFLLDFRSKLFILMCSQAHNLPLGLRNILSQITDMAVGDPQISISVMSLHSLPSLFIRQQTIYNLFLLSATILPAFRN